MASKGASNPYPPAGDTNGASPNVVLSWTGGDGAAVTNGHDVYFGTDQVAVLNGDAAVHVGLQTDTAWAPPNLVAGATYYWRVDEVNPSLSPSRSTGPVWSFRIFDGAGQPTGYEKGYATWPVNTMTPVNLGDNLPAGSPNPPAVTIALARCESAGFQLAVQPASGRRLDRIRLVVGDLTSGGNAIAASNISWQVVGVIHYRGSYYPDILLPIADFNAAADNTHSILVTVLAPEGTPAGIYTGTVTVKTDSGLDTDVALNVAVHGFAIPAASTAGSMHLRTTWTLSPFGTAADYQTYGDFLLSYRMCPDNIYRNDTPNIPTLEHWYDRGLNTFSLPKADNLWHPGDLGQVDTFFTALAASPLGSKLRPMAQFYGYDENHLDRYGDAAGQMGMRAVYGTIKGTYPDIPTTTTCHIYDAPWADPLGDMAHYYCDWMCAEQGSYIYDDGELLRNTVDPKLPANQRYQYWAYNAANSIGKFLYPRAVFWSLFQQKADGFLYYSVNGWPDLPNPAPIDPTTGPIFDYAYIPGQSDAVLMYCGVAGPLASMRMVNVRDGMQDWEYLWAIGHYDTDGVTRLGKFASVETARELAEQISVNWVTDTDPTHVISGRDLIAAWLDQPYVATHPTPEHRSKGLSVNPALTWKADSVNVSSFDVYFGTDRDAVLNATTASVEFRGNQGTTTFSPQGPLATNTNYYWRIDERVGTQVYKGYVWSFSCSFGLVGWWKFDEPAGTAAQDSSGLRHDATILGCSHAAGILNGCLEFDGAGCVKIPGSVLSTVDRQISIAFWLYGAEAQPQGEVLFEALAPNGDTVIRGRLPFSDRVAYFEAGASDVVSQSMKLTEAKSRWQYWVFTKNADTGHMKIYLNGVLWADAAGKTEVMETAAAFTVGSKCDGTLGYEGKIDEFRVYDGELQPADVTALYNIGGHRGDCGLMGWWRFDELSGPIAKDWSDLQNDGALHNVNQVRQAGKVGDCLAFNGSTDYVEVPVDGMIFPDPAVTLCVWTYGDSSLPNATSAYGSTAVNAVKMDGTTALLALIPFSDGSSFFRAGGDIGADTKLTSILQPSQYKGQWNHWVFARNHGGQSKIYLNGSLIASDANYSTDVVGTMAQLRIGTGVGGHEPYAYMGKLDEVRLYNYELSAVAVKNMYDADSTRFSGEVGRWKFDENAGATTADATPFGNTGMIKNATWANGRIGSALRFDGVSSNVSIPAAALASLDKQVTVTLWLKGAPFSSNNWIFEALDATNGPVIRARVDRRVVVFDSGCGGVAHFDEVEKQALAHKRNRSLRGNQWTHWAFTKNAISGDMIIYRNGVPWQSAAGKYRPLTVAASFRIGTKADGTSGYAGVIDDVRIYNLELNSKDIYNIYLDCPPLPNPMTWSRAPRAAGLSSISLTATIASHANGVEYYFKCVAGGGHDSGWQASPSYTDIGLAPRTRYSYQVKARERGPNQNETEFSPIRSATTRHLRRLP